MRVIAAQNVNDALIKGGALLREQGVRRDSRNGPVLVAPGPVTTEFLWPMDRVMLVPGRDANPFFHLVEALWMLAGRNDLKALTPYVRGMAQYSDDGGKTQPGAYGRRWRRWFRKKPFTNQSQDQLAWAVKRLRADPSDRRVVVQMYDPVHDQHAADEGGRDIPCNLSALFWVDTTGCLSMTVFNRSNDMVWGAYGANAVHFSVLLEWVAHELGLMVGQYYQVSNNFHMYDATAHLAQDPGATWDEPYAAGHVRAYPMFQGVSGLDQLSDDLEMFFEDPARVGIRSNFLRRIACPMVMAHRAYKQEGGFNGIRNALEILQQMPADCDWLAGALEWMSNREETLLRQQDDGVSHEQEEQETQG